MNIISYWTNNMIISCSTKKWSIEMSMSFCSSTCFWVFRSKPPNIQCQSTCRNASRAALAIFVRHREMSSVNVMARRNLESSPFGIFFGDDVSIILVLKMFQGFSWGHSCSPNKISEGLWRWEVLARQVVRNQGIERSPFNTWCLHSGTFGDWHPLR